MSRFIRTFAFFAFLLVSPVYVSAQSTSGIGLQPSLIEEGADPGQVLERSITLTNLSDNTQTYYLSKRDIVDVRDGGTPVYAERGIEKTGFELSEWLDLGLDELTLESGEKQQVSVIINIPDNATPGSHFGGIFVSMQPPRLREIGASVGYEVANIVSIRISGETQESAIIRSFRTDKFIYGSTNVDFMSEVENKGNVLIRPYGPLEVYNMFGQQVALLSMNNSQAGVFPFTKRDFQISWEDSGLGFGRYEAVLAMVYGSGGGQATISSNVSFWILPMNIITPALIVLAVLLLSTYIMIRLYVRRTVAAASGGRRLVQRRRRRSGGTSTLLLALIAMMGVTAIFLIILLALFA